MKTKSKTPAKVLILAILAGIACAEAPAQSGSIFFDGGLSLWQGSVTNLSWQYQQGLRAVAYGNGLFLALGDGGVTATSPEGLNWAVYPPSTNAALAGTPADLVFAQSRFLAVGNTESNAVFQVSTDGLAWSQPVTVPGANLRALVYDNGLYVSVGQQQGAAFVATSTDALNWGGVSLTNYGPLYVVTSGGGLFVAGGVSGLLLTSLDGRVWTRHAIATTNFIGDIHALAYGESRFVGSSSIGLLSTNGTDWTADFSAVLSDVGSYGLAYGRGRFVAIGTDILVSTNGLDWGVAWENGGPILPSKLDATFGGGSFVIVGQGGSFWGLTPDYTLDARPVSGGILALTVTGGATNQVYRLQTTSDLVKSNYRDISRWEDLFHVTNSGSSTNLVDSTATNAPRRFYRVVWP